MKARDRRGLPEAGAPGASVPLWPGMRREDARWLRRWPETPRRAVRHGTRGGWGRPPAARIGAVRRPAIASRTVGARLR